MIRLGILGRAAVPVVALSTLTVSSWGWLADLRHPARDGTTPFVDLVAAGSAWALHAGLAWLLLITLAVVAEAVATGGEAPASHRWSRDLGCPPALRRAVLVGCGLSVLVCAAPATAAPADPAGPLDLTGLVLPDRAVAAPTASTTRGTSPAASPTSSLATSPPQAPSQQASPASGPATAGGASTDGERAATIPPQQDDGTTGDSTRAAAPTDERAAPPRRGRDASPRAARPADPTGGAGTVVVRSGDTLWALAARRLSEPTDAAVAAEVARWSAANATTVVDPDLIHPGQRLTAPGSTDHEETR